VVVVVASQGRVEGLYIQMPELTVEVSGRLDRKQASSVDIDVV